MLLMGMALRLRGIEKSREIRDYIERRLRFALGRFLPEITAVSVNVSDLNGPRGGIDKKIKIQVTGPRLGHLLVEDVDADTHVVVDRASDRVARSVGRHLERRRWSIAEGFAG